MKAGTGILKVCVNCCHCMYSEIEDMLYCTKTHENKNNTDTCEQWEWEEE